MNHKLKTDTDMLACGIINFYIQLEVTDSVCLKPHSLVIDWVTM